MLTHKFHRIISSLHNMQWYHAIKQSIRPRYSHRPSTTISETLLRHWSLILLFWYVFIGAIVVPSYGNQKPEIVIVPSRLSGTAPLTVTFDASKSQDPDGSIVEFQWIFQDRWEKYGSVVTHTFRRGPNCAVHLYVKDNEGNTAMDSVVITINNPLKPLAAFSYKITGNPFEIRFDSRHSTGGDTYKWDFGDGSPILHDPWGDQHTYARAGIYIVTLTVSQTTGGNTEISKVSRPVKAVRPVWLEGSGNSLLSGIAGGVPAATYVRRYDLKFWKVKHVGALLLRGPFRGISSIDAVIFSTKKCKSAVDVESLQQHSAFMPVQARMGISKIPPSSTPAPPAPPYGMRSIEDTKATLNTIDANACEVSAYGPANSGFVSMGSENILMLTYPQQPTATELYMYICYLDDAVSDRGFGLLLFEDVVYAKDVIDLEYTNMVPVATFATNPSVSPIGETISFDASKSQDDDGKIVRYSWDFGDGATADEVMVSHNYTLPGDQAVTLTVTDDDGATAACTRTIRISEAGIFPADSGGRREVKSNTVLFLLGFFLFAILLGALGLSFLAGWKMRKRKEL